MLFVILREISKVSLSLMDQFALVSCTKRTMIAACIDILNWVIDAC